MKEILKDIKEGQLKQAYLLYGEEAYLRIQYKEKLLAAMTDPEDTMNFHCYEGKDIAIQEIITTADTLPFLAEYRTILIVDSGWFASSGSALDELVEYLKHPSETTRFLFVERDVDKRSKMYKAVSGLGYAAEFKEQDEDVLRVWITNMAAKEKKKITSSAASLLLQRIGTDMCSIRNEMDKLLNYTYGRAEITEQDIETMVAARLEDHIFQMIDAMVAKQQKKTIKLYYELLALKVQPGTVLYMIIRQFANLLHVKELKSKGYDRTGIIKELKLKKTQEFLADKYARQAAGFQWEELKQILAECIEIDEMNFSKASTIPGNLKSVGVETLLIKYSM